MIRARKGTRWRWFGRTLMVLALLGALARPGVGTVAANVANDAVDVVLFVNTSPSIAVEDWGEHETRLDGVRADIAELAVAHPGARYALITFSDTAVQRLLFTLDASALQNVLDTTHPDDYVFAQGSSPYVAANLLHDVLETAVDADPEGARARLVCYFGDGEQTSSETELDFSDSAELIQGGTVFGYGTESGAHMRAYDQYDRSYGDYIQDGRSYEPGISKLDEETLREVAVQLSVEYAHRDADTPVPPAVVDVQRGTLSQEAAGRMSFPIYWVFALGVIAWMLVEIVLLLRAGRELPDAIPRSGRSVTARCASKRSSNSLRSPSLMRRGTPRAMAVAVMKISTIRRRIPRPMHSKNSKTGWTRTVRTGSTISTVTAAIGGTSLTSPGRTVRCRT